MAVLLRMIIIKVLTLLAEYRHKRTIWYYSVNIKI